MGQLLHGRATTTETVRRAIQGSQASLRTLAKQYGINPKTVAKWKKRDHVQDAAMGPKETHSTVLSAEEEAVVVAFRKHTLLPLDDCLYTLQETIPHLTRSSLHRCLQRHGISRLPEVTDRPAKKSKFKKYPIGYFHIDITQVRTEEGKLYLFVAIDRTSKFAFVEVHERMTRTIAAEFLRRLLAAVPYKIHTILTDNGVQFTNQPHQKYAFKHLFDRVCSAHSIEHRLTKPNHPWTNGQVERMNRTLKDATVYRYYYDTHQQLQEHLQTFLMAYNLAKRLKTLDGLTPFEYICQQWQKQPDLFLQNPFHHTLGLYTYPVTTLTFDTVTTGAFGVIQTDMTLLLGSSAGGDQYGRVRVQNVATSTTIPIPRTSQGLEDGELTITDNAYITVLEDYRVWAKIPYIDANGNQKKDTNIAVGAYTGAGIPPVANCGPGFANYTSSGIITVDFSGSNSFAVADSATISTYAWDVKDGTIITGTVSTSAITVTFPAGFRWVALTVTDSNGVPHTARCPVLAVNAAADVTLPHVAPELTITPQGQRLTLRVTQDIPRATYPDGTLVMMWESTPDSPADRTHMQFIGWEQSNEADGRATRTGLLRGTQLTCVDVAGRLQALPGFPQSLERKATVNNWDKMIAPTMDKYIHYILLWHSTALSLADYFSSGTGSNYPFVIFASEGESLFDQVENDCKGLVPTYHFTCNRRGQLAVNVDPMLQPVVDRTATLQANFVEATTASIRFAYTRPPRVHWLRGHALLTATGYTVVDTVDTLLTVHCIAPGTAPGQGLGEQTTSEGLARSQSALNVAKGHEYARLNARFGLITVTPAVDENFDAVDPADLEWVALTVTSATAAQRGLTFADVRCQVKEIRRRWDNTRTGTVRHGEFTLEVETVGNAAVTVEPVGTPDTAYIPPLPNDAAIYTGSMKGYILWDGTDVLRTWDLSVASPTWERIDTGISGTILDGQYMIRSATTVGMWLMTTAGIFYCADIMATTPSWANKLTLATIQANDVAPTSGAVKFGSMTHYWSAPGHLCVATCPDAENDGYLHAYFWVTEDYGDTWTQVDMNGFTFGSGATERCYYSVGVHGLASLRSGGNTLWCGRGNGRTGSSTGDQAIFKSTDGGYTWTKGFTLAAWAPNQPALLNPFPLAIDPSYGVFTEGNGDSELYVSTDGWSTATNLTEPTGHQGGFVTSNQLQMANKQTSNNLHILAMFQIDASSAADIYESDDSGATWALLEAVSNDTITPNGWPPQVDSWTLIENVDDDSTPIIRLTLDNFGTFADKEGNLAAVLSGGTWNGSGFSGGYALPKISPNV